MLRWFRYRKAKALRAQRLRAVMEREIRELYRQEYNAYLRMGYKGATRKCLELALMRRCCANAGINLDEE